MWIKKFHRDQIEDKPSPIPTQVVSNEEFLPTPQTKQQKEVEALIQTLASQYGKKNRAKSTRFPENIQWHGRCFFSYEPSVW